MSGYVDWIGAQADDRSGGGTNRASRSQTRMSDLLKNLRRTALRGRTCQPITSSQRMPLTEGSLRGQRPGHLAIPKENMGVVAALYAVVAGGRAIAVVLGRELFRAKITAYTATTFESRVIFLHDMERCLDQTGHF